MANIFSLFGSIFVDNEKANKAIDETTKRGKKSSETFSETFSNVAKKTVAIGTAVVGAASTIVGGLYSMTKASSDTLGDLDDISQKVQMNAETFQEWDYVATQSGVTQEKLTNAMVKQQKAFADAREGSKSLQEAYNRLGIDINKVGDSSEAFDLVINKLADMEDETTRNAIANDIFGKSYADLNTILNQGTDGIKNIKQEAHDLGKVIDNETVAAGADFGDQIARVETAFSSLATKLGAKLFPIVNKLLDFILDNLPVIQQMFDMLAPVLIDSLDKIMPVFIQFAEEILPIIMDLVVQLMPTITAIIQELLPIFTEILGIILPPLIQIIQELLPILLPILEALLPLLMPLLELLSYLCETVLKPIISTITGIANVISKVLVTALHALSPVVRGIKTIFEDVFGGIYNIVKTPINFIIDGLNVFVRALNKIKVPNWVPFVGGKGINLPLINRLRVGIENVPYDEMPAILHKGETVLDKEEAQEYRDKKTKEKNNQSIVYNYYNTIQIDNLKCENEKDIKRIAEELYYLQKRSEV